MSSTLTLFLHGPQWLFHSLHKSSGLYSREKELERTHEQSMKRRGEAFLELTAAAELSSDLLARADYKIITLNCTETGKLRNRIIVNGLDQS